MSRETLEELTVIIRTASSLSAGMFLVLFMVLINKKIFSLYSPAKLNWGGTVFLAVGTIGVNVYALIKNATYTPVTLIQMILAVFFVLHTLSLIYYDKYVIHTERIINSSKNRGESVETTLLMQMPQNSTQER